LGFLKSFGKRHQYLVQKKADETISQIELNEIIEMTQHVESADALRLESVVQLAILRNINPKNLMLEMGLLKQSSPF
jgi:hypothetical protein